jgi:hypothetical protein
LASGDKAFAAAAGTSSAQKMRQNKETKARTADSHTGRMTDALHNGVTVIVNCAPAAAAARGTELSGM